MTITGKMGQPNIQGSFFFDQPQAMHYFSGNRKSLIAYHTFCIVWSCLIPPKWVPWTLPYRSCPTERLCYLFADDFFDQHRASHGATKFLGGFLVVSTSFKKKNGVGQQKLIQWFCSMIQLKKWIQLFLMIQWLLLSVLLSHVLRL